MGLFNRNDNDKHTLSLKEIKALVEQADALCEQEKYDEAFVLDKRAAEAGDPRAQTHMGWYYENGYGTQGSPADSSVI